MIIKDDKMLQFEELRLALENLEPDLKDLEDALGLHALKNEIEELEHKQAEPGFWDDTENSQKILKRAGSLKNKVLYPVAVVKNTDHESQARAVVEFLKTDEAMAVFEKYGFSRAN